MMKFDRTKGRPEPIRALNLIREKENGEPLVDMAIFAPKVRPIRDSVIPYVRKSVAEMCQAAAEKLPEGYYLGLVEGWRPLQRQQRIYDFMWKCAREAFPDRDHAALRRTVCRWVAPTDQKAPPGHCTGAAVDVWLVDEQGEQIDVTSPYTRFQAAPTYVYGLSDTAQANRMLLTETMLSVGFSNCRDEWWHYSYGDAGWAVRTGASECQYGVIHLPIEMYEELELKNIQAFVDRPNPFLDVPTGT